MSLPKTKRRKSAVIVDSQPAWKSLRAFYLAHWGISEEKK